MAITGWLSLFGSQPRFDGRGRTHGLVRRLRRVPAIDNWLRARGENSFRFAGRGHTVCITGIKEEAQS